MKVMDNAQMDFYFNMSQPCSETTPTLHHAHDVVQELLLLSQNDVVQEREGNKMVVDAQTPALLLPLHRLAADDEDQGGRGEQEGLLVSGEGEHQHHQHHHIIVSKEHHQHRHHHLYLHPQQPSYYQRG